MGQKPTALLVTDDDQFSDSMSDELESLGWRSLVVVSGVKAIQLLRREQVQFAVVDLDTFGLSVETLIRLVQNDWPSMPIVAVSAALPKVPPPGGIGFLLKSEQSDRDWFDAGLPVTFALP